MPISLIAKLKLQCRTHIFDASCFQINGNGKIMFSFQVSLLESEQELCKELSRARGEKRPDRKSCVKADKHQSREREQLNTPIS